MILLFFAIIGICLPFAMIRHHNTHRKCPHCLEEVKKAASVCLRCHRDLPPDLSQSEQSREEKHRLSEAWSTRWKTPEA